MLRALPAVPDRAVGAIASKLDQEEQLRRSAAQVGRSAGQEPRALVRRPLVRVQDPRGVQLAQVPDERRDHRWWDRRIDEVWSAGLAEN